MAKTKTKQLFDDGDEDTAKPIAKKSESNLKINKEFAEKFDKRETKKLLQKGKDLEPSEESSEYSEEDSDGVLINDTVEKKFLETIARIRAKDPSLKNTTTDVFEDKDFDIENIKEKVPEEKPVTFKTLMADKVKKKFGENLEKNINEVSDDDSEYDELKQETDVQMQRRLKQDFIKAAQGDVSDDDILQMKEKTKQQIEKGMFRHF